MLNLDLSRRAFLRKGGAVCLGGSLAVGIEASAFPPAKTDNRPLRKLADELGIQIGTCLSGWLFVNEDPRILTKYRTLVAREFNLAVVSWSTSWASVEPREGGLLDFSNLDTQVLWAQKFKMAIMGHTLLFPTEPTVLPEWLRKGNPSREKVSKLLRNHITRLMRRYKGRVKNWLVVNEPYHPPYRKEDFFQDKIGPEYLEMAFETARAADKDARLIYCDTQNHTPTGISFELTKKHLKMLKAKKLVDAVALQMHLDGKTPPKKQEVIDAMKAYELPVWVTEMDINMTKMADTPKKRAELQAPIYRDMVEACLESGVCKTISFWEIGDKWSWLVKPTPGNPDVVPDAAPTLFDDDLDPKPAYRAVKELLAARVAARPKKGK
jgi:endo-1,4-beta-xylanase